MRRFSPFLLVLIFATKAHGYYPPNCSAEYAATDFTDADAVVIARVIKIERKLSDFIQKRKNGEVTLKCVDYVATLKVGKVIRGEAKKNDELFIYEGGYIQKEEDNSEITWVRTCGSHSRTGFQIDGVYVLFINMHRGSDGKVDWTPRSCHFSIHKLEDEINETTGTQTIVVRESLGMWGKTKPPVPLEAFLEAKKKQADETKKAESSKKTEETKP